MRKRLHDEALFRRRYFLEIQCKSMPEKEAATCRKLVRRQSHTLCHCNTIYLWLGQRDDLVEMVRTRTEHNTPNDNRLEQLSQRSMYHCVEWKS
ncbi:hypothetical protein MXB_1982 [Myxobolus squamalis]|nr:hypothetical protein MXB_1982 [Myxobolus squamalis]